jgi:hypothetical protein
LTFSLLATGALLLAVALPMFLPLMLERAINQTRAEGEEALLAMQAEEHDIRISPGLDIVPTAEAGQPYHDHWVNPGLDIVPPEGKHGETQGKVISPGFDVEPSLWTPPKHSP